MEGGDVHRRQVGVEEELFLFDADTLALRPVSGRILREDGERYPDDDGKIARIQQELFLEQVETATEPCTTLADLGDQVREGRRRAALDANAYGAVLAAAGSVIDEPAAMTQKSRYQRMADLHGAIARENLICGTHVHVEVADDAEAVRALDRIRPWLPVVLAVSANSPFWYGQDSGYASFRAQVVRRWPTAGPTEPFGTPRAYHDAVADLISSGAALDEGMIYFDARLAVKYPTLEIRVADTCTEIADTVLVAALSRALVETAATQDGVPEWRSELLRAAAWQASRWGLSRELLDPVHRVLRPAFDVIEALLDHVGAALDAAGDTSTVRDTIKDLHIRGTGSVRQRAAFAHRSAGSDVVRDVIERTRATYS
jgi:carboxylate-amine ligase